MIKGTIVNDGRAEELRKLKEIAYQTQQLKKIWRYNNSPPRVMSKWREGLIPLLTSLVSMHFLKQLLLF